MAHRLLLAELDGAARPSLGFVKRLPSAKLRVQAPPTPNPATEQLTGGWTYTPGSWRGEAPTYQGD